MDELMNSDWTITIVGGIVSTVIGGIISKMIEKDYVPQHRNYSISSLTFWSFVFVFELVWTAIVLNLLYPLIARTHTFGEGFGGLLAFGLWVGVAAQIPRMLEQSLSQ